MELCQQKNNPNLRPCETDNHGGRQILNNSEESYTKGVAEGYGSIITHSVKDFPKEAKPKPVCECNWVTSRNLFPSTAQYVRINWEVIRYLNQVCVFEIEDLETSKTQSFQFWIRKLASRIVQLIRMEVRDFGWVFSVLYYFQWNKQHFFSAAPFWEFTLKHDNTIILGMWKRIVYPTEKT